MIRKHLMATVFVMMIGAVASAGASFVAFLGDSNTWLGGDRCDRPLGWTSHLAAKYPGKTFRSYARSGATWSHTPATRTDTGEYSEVITDNNVISNQLERLWQDVEREAVATPELIVMAAGTNDAWFEKKFRPGCLDPEPGLSPLKLEGAARAVIRHARSLFPKAVFVILTPMQSTAVADEVIHRASQLLENGCRNEPATFVVRLDTLSRVTSAAERKCRKYTYDGTHTSEAGAASNANIVDKYLKDRGIILSSTPN